MLYVIQERFDKGPVSDQYLEPAMKLIRSHPALSPSPLGLCDLCRGLPARSVHSVYINAPKTRLLD
jgi:hypothetical protein